MKERDPLVVAFRILKNAAPEEFMGAMGVFERYTNEVTVAVTDAPPEHILNMQGRAAQCRGLLMVLQDALKDPRTQ